MQLEGHLLMFKNSFFVFKRISKLLQSCAIFANCSFFQGDLNENFLRRTSLF